MSKQAKTKNLPAAKAETALAAPMDQAWGSEGLSNADILVPKILLMQGLSKKVMSGDATQGQLLDSLSDEVLGGITNIKAKTCKDLEVIAFSSFKTWIESEKEGEKFEYRTQYPMTPGNEGQEQEYINEQGKECRRDRCLNFYVLRPEQIAKGEALPYVISFRRTSFRAGRKIATIAAQLKALGNKPLAFKHLKLTVVPMKNEKGEFWAFDVSAGGNSTPQELEKAYEWHKALMSKTVNIRVDDSDLKEGEAPQAETEY